MKEELSLQCPYKVSLDTLSNSYKFTTAGGASYEVLFSLSNEILSGTYLDGADAFHVVVSKITEGDRRRDIKVAQTIDSIVDHFFLIKNRIFFYICDSIDNRHSARFRMFNMWYSKSLLRNKLLKVDYQIRDEELTYYASFVFDKENDLGEEKVLESFEVVRQVLQEVK